GVGGEVEDGWPRTVDGWAPVPELAFGWQAEAIRPIATTAAANARTETPRMPPHCARLAWVAVGRRDQHRRGRCQMPDENVETVRNAFEAWRRGDLAALTDLIDPDVEWSWWQPGPWDCHGRDQVLQVM